MRRRFFWGLMIVMFGLIMVGTSRAEAPRTGQGESASRTLTTPPEPWDTFEKWFKVRHWKGDGQGARDKRKPQSAADSHTTTKGWDHWREPIYAVAKPLLIERLGASFVLAEKEKGSALTAEEAENWITKHFKDSVTPGDGVVLEETGKRFLVGAAWSWLEGHHLWPPERHGPHPVYKTRSEPQCGDCSAYMGECLFCYPTPCDVCP